MKQQFFFCFGGDRALHLFLSYNFDGSISGTMSGRSLFSQPGGRLELYQAIEPMVAAAIKPTINTNVAEERKMGSVGCYFHHVISHAIAS
jgi:hypothetical protein